VLFAQGGVCECYLNAARKRRSLAFPKPAIYKTRVRSWRPLLACQYSCW